MSASRALGSVQPGSMSSKSTARLSTWTSTEMIQGSSIPRIRHNIELFARLGGMFRFAITPPRITSLAAWTDALSELEDAGFDSIVVADHFTEGWDIEPMVALTAAAA